MAYHRDDAPELHMGEHLPPVTAECEECARWALRVIWEGRTLCCDCAANAALEWLGHGGFRRGPETSYTKAGKAGDPNDGCARPPMKGRKKG